MKVKKHEKETQVLKGRRLICAGLSASFRRRLAPAWVKSINASFVDRSKARPFDISSTPVEPYQSELIRNILLSLPPSKRTCRFRGEHGCPSRGKPQWDRNSPHMDTLDDSLLDQQDRLEDRLASILTSDEAEILLYRELHSILLSWNFDPPKLRELALRGRRFSFSKANVKVQSPPPESAGEKQNK